MEYLFESGLSRSILIFYKEKNKEQDAILARKRSSMTKFSLKRLGLPPHLWLGDPRSLMENPLNRSEDNDLPEKKAPEYEGTSLAEVFSPVVNTLLGDDFRNQDFLQTYCCNCLLFTSLSRSSESGPHSPSLRRPNHSVQIEPVSAIRKKDDNNNTPTSSPKEKRRAHKPYQAAVDKLKEISSVNSPWHKLACLRESVGLIETSINSFWEGKPTEEIILNSENMTQLLVHVLLRANVPNLCAQLSFINDWLLQDMVIGQDGYHHTLYLGSVEYLLQDGLSLVP